ncbi:MAG: hypothetical protein ACC656_07445 [Candidatus Heimdallarchaeota archaeon]
MTKDNIKIELKQLEEYGCSLTREEKESISFDLNSSKAWAEIFWWRRESHLHRVDPEVEFLKNSLHSKILEIGAAYGRILGKISLIRQFDLLYGIELCPFFEPYFEEYKNINNLGNNINITYESFFDTTKWSNNFFDCILLPMNTIPSFSPQKIKQLFLKVYEILSNNGDFIFTVHKFDSDRIEKTLSQSKFSQASEVFTNSKSQTIKCEFLGLPAKKTDYGFEKATFHVYSFFDNNDKVKSKEIYRTSIHVMFPSLLDDIIEDLRFKIQLVDDKSHSRMYVVSKSK